MCCQGDYLERQLEIVDAEIEKSLAFGRELEARLDHQLAEINRAKVVLADLSERINSVVDSLSSSPYLPKTPGQKTQKRGNWIFAGENGGTSE